MKVRYKEGDAVVVFNVQTGNFGQMTTFYANLNKKKHYYIEDNQEILMDWDECFQHIEDHFDEFVKDVTTRTYNNVNVIGSYRMSGDEKKAEKAEKHLENNKALLEILNDFITNRENV